MFSSMVGTGTEATSAEDFRQGKYSLDQLIAACDSDGDGQVSYAEFVDVFALDTVAPAALGKRGMQAQEAMGVADLDKAFLGHGSAPKSALVMGE